MRIKDVLTKKRQDFRLFIDLIREDYRTYWKVRDGTASTWTMPGFRALAVHRFGVWVATIGRPWPLRAMLNAIYSCLYVHVRNHYTIQLPPTTKVGRRLVISHQGGIVIHHLAKIGDDCIILQNATLGAAGTARFMQAPILGNRVQIGCGAAVIGGVVIGDDVHIGPNAVVSTDIPAGSIVVAPAPRVFQLKKEQDNVREPAVEHQSKCVAR